ncbi:aspartate-semialdehyde dehydrogenase [Phenylobacterium sp.]|jgi:aspartate-semialdehyde dehydrogenase|uniref:aspartate-semialdehyde dehydrogenase n=1 Tax=Phenylobacterium sp. TaxID=1871053 RepID=UPI002E35C58D|nr:aspartate-semialdehyde dehydrogenase [Phenylobacterium sp.]HEX2561762.1 aspartate-semialdehyde dehydrogenase [Phenylobacterium sp.]
MLQSPGLQAGQRAANVAIVGATGAVGVELIGCLQRRGFPTASLRLLASERSAGRRIGEHVVEAVSLDAFAGVDVAFFSAGAGVSRAYAPIAAAQGALVVDNSSAFRMDPNVALVVPEVNAGDLPAGPGIVANPNCVTAVSVMALGPLRALGGITRVIGATYQSASGAGAAAMDELTASTAAQLAGQAFAPKVLPHPYAFNLFSHNAAVDPQSGYNGEEEKVMAEHRKILGLPDLRISFTCIRVPVLRAHSMALSVEFDRPVSPEAAREILAAAPGVRVVDDRAGNHFPMPVEASGEDDVLVGRIRQDLSDPEGRTLALFLSGDQLLRGAALNAVLIAERLWR